VRFEDRLGEKPEMNRKAARFTASAAFVLLATAATAFAAKPVTPKLGSYESANTESTNTVIKVVRIGDRWGAEFNASGETTCTDSSGRASQLTYYWSEEKPTPIKNGRFTFKSTKHETVSGGLGTGTLTFQISGTFKSPTKVVGRQSLHGSYDYPSIPSVGELTCVANVGFTAKHK
jgi:hypothetical protein